ncbi:hypothetical protein F441_22877 [Phytophthora nicotianae CJ01A1]|uniref:Uncharacterized protein n=1 Tax=Phytophthora nicotianae CJ01A1 TaxID=1317063 RepID=W2VPX9_PHYNI|nr:hypothetical protein F441_22877 [Phytophthora nicotianae CJ01A1]
MAVHPPQQYALEQGGPFRVSKTPTFATSPLINNFHGPSEANWCPTSRSLVSGY